MSGLGSNFTGAGPSNDPHRKILSRADLLRLRAEARAAGRRVVQCHGCFDIVHPGHVRHLRYARHLGDVLLVTLTGDGEVAKGKGRPLIPEELRAENLAALDCVDWVYVEARPTAAELLEEVRPDVYVKGREYEFNADPRFAAERRAVEDHGGRVVFSSGDVVFSSSALIAALEHTADPFHERLTQLTRTPALSGPRLYERIAGFRGRRVLVVGETVVDTYVLCDRPEVAGEGPVMTLRPLEKRRYDGGAAVVARHVAALGGRPVLVTPLPEGPEGEALRRRLAGAGVEVVGFSAGTTLPEKQRFLAGAQKLMKVDMVEPYVLDQGQQDAFVETVRAAAAAAGGGGASGCDGAIVADFGLGLFTPTLTARVCDALRPLAGVLAGDVSGRRSNLRAMRQLDLLCPSESELREAYRAHDEGLPAVAWRLLEETGARASIVTMGADGLISFERTPEHQRAAGSFPTRLKAEHVPALCPVAVDPMGCGDALLATATLSLASGASLLEAGFLGACAAAVQVQRLGNPPVTGADLRTTIARLHASHLALADAETIAHIGAERARRAS